MNIHNDPITPFIRPTTRWHGARIGLYGGSFNPAHDGHVHVSLEALKRLKLDAIWWLVSPGNPLKEQASMAPLMHRVEKAQALAQHPRIYISCYEQALQTRFTIDSLQSLMKIHRRTRFVWLMGADNLAQFDQWHAWREIMSTLSVAVIDRPGYAKAAFACRAAKIFQAARLKEAKAASLANRKPPCWSFLHVPQHSASATALRQTMDACWWQKKEA